MGDLTQLFHFFENWNPVVAALTAFITLATLIIVFVQLRVMRSQQNTMQDQSSLMQGQLEIVQRQDQLIQAQLAQRTDLAVFVEVKIPDHVDGNMRLIFVVRNAGKRAARGFHWHLYIPTDRSGRNFSPHEKSGLPSAERKHIEGVEHHVFISFFPEPVYPHCEVLLGDIALHNRSPGDVHVYWRINAEDGLFPEEGVSKVQISIPAET